MRRYFLSIAFFLSLLTPALHAANTQSHPRQIQQFTEDWRFLPSDAPGAESPTFDDSACTPVTPPPAGTPAQASSARLASSPPAPSASPHGEPWSPRPKSPQNPPQFMCASQLQMN